MADELISRQAALEMAFADGEFKGLVSFWDLQILPAVDAVEVVRCKNCRSLYDEPDDYCCFNHKGLVHITPDSYCSYGERREENAAD